MLIASKTYDRGKPATPFIKCSHRQKLKNRPRSSIYTAVQYPHAHILINIYIYKDKIAILSVNNETDKVASIH